MRILIIGTVKFSEIVFLELISMGANVVRVCTSKEPEINSDHVNLKAVSDKHKVACLETQDVNDQESLFLAINYIVENYSSMSKNCMTFSNQFISEQSYLNNFIKIIKSFNENIAVK